MDRAQKEQVLGEIKEAWQNVASIIVADYAGITVPVVTAMRDDFRKNGCHYRVLKNSLVKIAVKGSKMEPLTQLMTGTTAVIWTTGEAPQPPATIALKWAKDQPKFKIKGGYYEGQVLDAAGVDLGDDLVQRHAARAEHGAVQEHVLAPRELGVEPAPKLQHRRDPAPHRDLTAPAPDACTRHRTPHRRGESGAVRARPCPPPHPGGGVPPVL